MNDQASASFLKPHHKLWLAIDWCDLLRATPVSRKTINRHARAAKRWYVYILWRDDLGAPVLFYIGKGTNRRIGQHTAPSDRMNRYKSALLSMLKRRGIPVRFSIVDSFENEDSALQLEVDLISQVGRSQLKDGPLVNRTLGGDGTRGHLAKSRGDSYSARPVVANQVAYACLEDAAEALGVTAGALSGRIANGWDGYFYQDEGQRPLKDGVVGRYRRAVRTPSGEFASMSEAAAATGETVNSIYKRIRYGWPGYFYPEEGQRPRRRPEKPCRIEGRVFQSQVEAAEILGIERAALRVRLRSSNFPDWVDLSGAIEKETKQAQKIQKLWIDDVEYPSAEAAASALGVKAGTILFRLRSSNFRDAALAKAAVAINVAGVDYATLSEASRELGVDINTLKKRCRSLSFPLYTSHDPALQKAPPKDGRAGLIPISINGVAYRSISAASQSTGEPRASIRSKLEDHAFPNYKKLHA